MVDNLRGISLLVSPGNKVAKNTITKLGTGIRAFGSCPNSTLTCNILDKNFHGFLFEGPADISDQLTGAIPTGNTWTTLGSPGASDIDVDLVLTLPLTSWYRDSYSPTLTNNPSSLSGGGATFTSNSAICSQFQIQPPVDDRENKLGAIVRNEKSFNSFTDEFILSDKNFAFKFLKENPTYLSLGTTDDSLYQNFYQNCNNTCVGKFENVNDYALSDNLSNAENLNNSISTNIQWESNLKAFNEIHIRYLNGDTVTLNDSILLENIAYDNAIDGGFGVFSSRAFLNLDIEDTPAGTVRGQFFEAETVHEKLTPFAIFPNPANGSVQINLEDENVIYDFNIKDITGKIILQQNNIHYNQILNLNHLSKGVYLIEFISNTQIIYSTKLVIIK